MATKKNEVSFELAPIKKISVAFEIVGDTPLIVHNFSEKARRQMLEAQTKKNGGKAKHEIKIPVNDFMNSLYWLTQKPEDGKSDDEALANFAEAVKAGAIFGFPVSGIKQSIVMGAYRAGLDVKTTELKGCFFLKGAAEGSTSDLAAIVAPTPIIREDMVRVGGMSKTADVRHRAEFREWRIPLVMELHGNGKYTAEQLLNCVDYGGMYCGIGEWRPEKDGQSGMYHLRID